MFELSCCKGLRFLLDCGTGSSGNRIRSLILAISSSSWAETWSRNCVQTNRNCWNKKSIFCWQYRHTHILPTSSSCISQLPLQLHLPVSANFLCKKKKSRLMRSPHAVCTLACVHIYTRVCMHTISKFSAVDRFFTEFGTDMSYFHPIIHNKMDMQSCVTGVPPAPLTLQFWSYSNRSWKHQHHNAAEYKTTYQQWRTFFRFQDDG